MLNHQNAKLCILTIWWLKHHHNKYQLPWWDTTVFTILIERDANLDAKDIRELTALHISAGYGNVNAIRVLKELGANVNTPDSIGHTPLYIATKQGHADAIRVLKELGAEETGGCTISKTIVFGTWKDD